MKRYLLKHLAGAGLCALIFLFGLTVRLLAAFGKGDFKAFVACESVRIAISLASTGAYADAYGPGGGANSTLRSASSALFEPSLPHFWDRRAGPDGNGGGSVGGICARLCAVTCGSGRV